MIREAIDIVVSGHSLTREQATEVMQEIMEGEATPAQLGAFLTALRLKGESTEEIAGMAAVMREKALRVNVEGPLLDVVGTGGDGKNTFNISTASAFVAAACGARVAKHGNRAASSSCGAADVLEALGVKVELTPEGVAQCIEQAGMGFMFAPAFHPSMRYAAPVRREIGIRTVFNILGPLTNPAHAQCMLLGVAYEQLGGLMAQALRLLDIRHALVVHGADGMDEISLSGPSTVWEVKGGEVSTWTIDLADTGLASASTEDLRGGAAEENAATMRRLFQGEGGPIRDAVLLNSAAALLAADKAASLSEGISLAAEAIDGGAALARVDALVEVSKGTN
ncbi:MAG: anthranilate phosphoribosyltransferase [Chloroflexota bacterium]|nr:anthranilate phosphoribosyltransferase [Chloroflexota bacterium]